MKCGFYQKEITPPLGCYIPGYGTDRRGTGVKDPLYVRAVVLEDDAGNKSAIAVLDSLMVDMEHTEAILARVKEHTDLTDKNTVITCTHSHTGTPFWEYNEQDLAYMEQLFRMAADCIILAWQRLRPCSVTYGKRNVEGFSFTRDFIMKNGTIRSNPGSKYRLEILRETSPADTEFAVLFFRDSDGNPIGSVSNFACHCDCVGGTEYSADFPGVLSRLLKEEYGADFVSVFLQGCSGDINHIDQINDIRSDYREMGRVLAETVKKLALSGQPLSGNAVRAARKELYIRRRLPTPELFARAKEVAAAPELRKEGEAGAPAYKYMLKYVADYEGKPMEVRCPVQAILLADVWIFCLPGEMYHYYGEELKKRCHGGKALIAELCNTRAGYCGRPELLENGPIPNVFGSWLQHAAFLEKDAGEKIMHTALELADTLRSC